MFHDEFPRRSCAASGSLWSGFVPANVGAIAKPFHIGDLGHRALIAAGDDERRQGFQDRHRRGIGREELRAKAAARTVAEL